MLNSTLVNAFIGLVLGVLAGLGVGGGSLLMLWLTLVLDMEPIVAKSVNLLFFLPTALAASVYRWRKTKPPWKIILPAAIAGCCAAAICAWLGQMLDTDLLKKLFGILMLFTAFRELTYQPKL